MVAAADPVEWRRIAEAPQEAIQLLTETQVVEMDDAPYRVYGERVNSRQLY